MTTNQEPNPTRRPRWLLHLALFIATFVTATWSQSLDLSLDTSIWSMIKAPIEDPRLLREGLTFAVTLLAILLAHEMGHYLVARHYGVSQSLPYFIPAPTLLGTLGAVILMRSRPPNRSVLLRVAVAGPIAGFVLAVPAAAFGLMHSTALTSAPSSSELVIGGSLLWSWLAQAFVPESAMFIDLHPVAMAAWAGLLVTSLNLIPAAQLDGGHISYALFGRRHLTLAKVVVVLLVVIGLLLGAVGAGFVWLFWAALLTFMGLRHPEVQDEHRRLSPRDRLLGYAALGIFVLTFVPAPLLQIPPGMEIPSGLEQPLEHDTSDGEEFRL